MIHFGSPSLRFEAMLLLFRAVCRGSAHDNAFMQINNGTYRSGFATSQAAYDNAQGELYSGLEAIEQRLSKSRFLLGDRYYTSSMSHCH